MSTLLRRLQAARDWAEADYRTAPEGEQKTLAEVRLIAANVAVDECVAKQWLSTR